MVGMVRVSERFSGEKAGGMTTGRLQSSVWLR